MRILTFSTLFPNSIQPYHGLFVERRLNVLTESFPVEAKVVAPIPWFPFDSEFFGRYARLAKVPKDELRNNRQILHPRYPMVPGVGMYFSAWLIAWATRRVFAHIKASGFDFDLIDAHYLYPDGVAAVMLGKWLQKPVVLTARGSDVNVLPDYRIPRRLICWAVRESAATVTVSRALRDRLVELGSDPAQITVLRNGVDLHHFRPLDRMGIRQKLGIDGPLLLSVGNLVEGKGHDLVISALPKIAGAYLFIAGSGPEKSKLEKLVRSLKLEARVRFFGAISQAELTQIYNAADLLVLASAREGMPNVVLESLACGTAVVATNTGGIPELVTDSSIGVLMQTRSVDAILDAVNELLGSPPDRAVIRRFAEQFGWEQTTNGLFTLFDKVSTRSAA